MAFTNTKESGLEALIVKWMVEQNGYEQGTKHACLDFCRTRSLMPLRS